MNKYYISIGITIIILIIIFVIIFSEINKLNKTSEDTLYTTNKYSDNIQSLQKQISDNEISSVIDTVSKTTAPDEIGFTINTMNIPNYGVLVNLNGTISVDKSKNPDAQNNLIQIGQIQDTLLPNENIYFGVSTNCSKNRKTFTSDINNEILVIDTNGNISVTRKNTCTDSMSTIYYLDGVWYSITS